MKQLTVTVPNLIAMTVDYRYKGTAHCSIGDAPFDFVLHFQYTPRNGLLLEFVAFDEWMDTIAAEEPTTIEQLADKVAKELSSLLEPAVMAVVIEATTEVHGPAGATVYIESRKVPAHIAKL